MLCVESFFNVSISRRLLRFQGGRIEGGDPIYSSSGLAAAAEAKSENRDRDEVEGNDSQVERAQPDGHA